MTMSNANLEMLDAVVRELSVADVHALSVGSLGLDAELLDLESPEALAGLIRRAASFLAPCSPRALREAVLRALDGVAASAADARGQLRTSIDEMIEALTCYGDLLELPAVDLEDGAPSRTLYLAPPTFVRIDDVLFLLGGAFDGGDPVPSDLRAAVEYRSHTRRMCPEDTSEVAKLLRAIGWVELPSELWLRSSGDETPKQVVDRANLVLASSPSTGEVVGLVVLDTDAKVTYYKGRWTEPTRKTGRYVARREQRYGADLWSYVELTNGAATHLVDLPLDKRSNARPCDAAWHLQMAIDAMAGRPQLYRRRPLPPAGVVLVDFFSPAPLWARRRWDVLGEEIARSRSLFSYSFPINIFTDVELTLRSALWLAEVRSP